MLALRVLSLQVVISYFNIQCFKCFKGLGRDHALLLRTQDITRISILWIICLTSA